MKISDWVHTVHNMNKITGFITEVTDNTLSIFVAVPENYGELEVNKNDIVLGRPMLGPDELSSLIDFALQVKDRGWFQELSHELSLWRPIEDILK